MNNVPQGDNDPGADRRAISEMMRTLQSFELGRNRLGHLAQTIEALMCVLSPAERDLRRELAPPWSVIERQWAYAADAGIPDTIAADETAVRNAVAQLAAACKRRLEQLPPSEED